MREEKVVTETKGIKFVVEVRKRAHVSGGKVKLHAEIWGIAKGKHGETTIDRAELTEVCELFDQRFYDIIREFESKILDAKVAIREKLVKASVRIETLINHGFPLSLYY